MAVDETDTQQKLPTIRRGNLNKIYVEKSIDHHSFEGTNCDAWSEWFSPKTREERYAS